MTDYVCVTVNPLPEVTIADQVVCADVTSVDLTALEPVGQTGGMWSVATPTSVDPSTGPFVYTYTEPLTMCMDTAEVTYTITPLPDASFIIADFVKAAIVVRQ
ncbi:MAG: hypothetical protein R2798_06905 [Chitinophagales bacterium]